MEKNKRHEIDMVHFSYSRIMGYLTSGFWYDSCLVFSVSLSRSNTKKWPFSHHYFPYVIVLYWSLLKNCVHLKIILSYSISSLYQNQLITFHYLSILMLLWSICYVDCWPSIQRQSCSIISQLLFLIFLKKFFYCKNTLQSKVYHPRNTKITHN